MPSIIKCFTLATLATLAACGGGGGGDSEPKEEELKSFKQLTDIKNRKLLDSVIATYCEIGMCNYSTILMMYQEQLKASKKELTW
mgnify:CR=1 FL=1